MNKEIIRKSADFVKSSLVNAESGHNWQHIYRVWSLSKKIASSISSNLLIVELGALFHDIADHKFYNGNREIAPTITKDFLLSLNLNQQIIDHVVQIVRNVSWSKEKSTEKQFHSIELDIVQDADRLEAIGAIGVARAFHYGGYKNNEIYNPNVLPNTNGSPTTINHFYEKLLHIKDSMNTDIGKKIAHHRHEFMQNYLKEFFQELQDYTLE